MQKEDSMTNHDPTIRGVFPSPLYMIKRESNITLKEEKEIEEIIKEGMEKNSGNSSSQNFYIFNSKFKEIKQFCEEQIQIYVEQIIVPKEDLDFYITQSWLNITNPGGFHHKHSHQNSIISGVFYISTEENDKITFEDPNYRIKQLIKFDCREYNAWNSSAHHVPSIINELILFPSWLEHSVLPNEKATRDRISISFNTFVRGNLGKPKELSGLILK
jgi:uncharacterized protein (TIGR02466 family)